MKQQLLILCSIFCLLPFFKAEGQNADWFLKNREYLKKKELFYVDFVYESSFRSIQFYPKNNTSEASLSPPIVPLSRAGSLVLEFDELGEEAGYYSAKLIHCNQNWQPSILRPIEYLKSYNEFDLQNFEFSVNTQVNYTHFSFQVPPVTVSGNYLLVLYHEDDENNLVLTRRFVVYEDACQIGGRVQMGVGTEGSQKRQQLQVNVVYTSPILFPKRSVKAVIRQNQRWDNALYNLSPLFVNEQEQSFDFNYFSGETEFEGGNEFRWFDTRAGFGGGFQVQEVQRFPEAWEAKLYVDKPWDRVYNQQRIDHNGGYFIGTQNGDPGIEGDYFIVEFTLASGNPYTQDVYVIGAFNNWQPSEAYKMQYVNNIGAYKLRAFFKQGFFDYRYALLNPQTNQLETNKVDGTHSRASNEYDIILYYRNPGEKADRVIGYQRLQSRF